MSKGVVLVSRCQSGKAAVSVKSKKKRALSGLKGNWDWPVFTRGKWNLLICLLGLRYCLLRKDEKAPKWEMTIVFSSCGKERRKERKQRRGSWERG